MKKILKIYNLLLISFIKIPNLYLHPITCYWLPIHSFFLPYLDVNFNLIGMVIVLKLSSSNRKLFADDTSRLYAIIVNHASNQPTLHRRALSKLNMTSCFTTNNKIQDVHLNICPNNTGMNSVNRFRGCVKSNCATVY